MKYSYEIHAKRTGHNLRFLQGIMEADSMFWQYARALYFDFLLIYNVTCQSTGCRGRMAQVLKSQTRPAQGRRSVFEIRMDILRVAAAGPVKPTHIMYRSNTSWVAMQKNIESLVVSGFIRQSDGCSRTEYVITERGRDVLRDYVSLVDRASAYPAEVQE